jgi:hypothetical protein
VADDGVRHDSACWLPREATGLTADAEQLRTNATLEGRTGAAKKIADQIAGDVKGPVAS